MKKFLLIALAVLGLLLFLFSCKTRQVQKSKIDITQQSDSSALKKQTSSSIDNSKINTQTKAVVADSSSSEVDIVTDTGTVKAQLNKDGSFTFSGKAKKVIVKSKAGHNQAITNVKQQDIAKSTQTAKLDSAAVHKEKDIHAQNKNSKSSFDLGKTLECIAVFALLVIIIYLFLKYKSRGAAAAADDIKRIL